ncbi:hypothetical protein A3H26_01695 [candidate division WWE3 bacterium RIFCSPLOWO2_12_FULL_36_10]|uniref:Vitamin K epoxide reductase domain-containing protein n=1 Tax=candidate division WWE3 bacterium RIFCSPLOWO2_12_FULL_36_10 TaxID=1802630 RepID=A0A1F4VH13_UNCKA|nr:MAG: hypothetical protein A3H26_01695 [candidate division WWE3 bacterium RIFCSPLOWO2_12_FULL_36_10]
MSLAKTLKILAIIGILISLYLTYVKLTSSPLLCAFGDCEKVQNSKYSQVFGIPVAVFGILYYFILYIMLERNNKYTKYWLLWGIMYSTYLTYLELFVIKAICGWCVLSFVNIILIYALHYIGSRRSKTQKQVN